MKNLILASFMIFSGLFLIDSGKVSAQEKPPTKEELKKMMEELDPEELEMMKKMGIDVSELSKLEQSGAKVEVGEDFPKRDEARIAQVEKTKLSSDNLAPYLAKVHSAVSSKFGSEAVSDAKELFDLADSPEEKAQLANGLWMFGSTAYAIIVLGNTLQSDPDNTDYLNNYSAFLTMAGAEEVALPILKYLNTTYPKNSTILNNLGQAWFGLGDIPTAEAYIDSTLMLYPGHSQANLTKSIIEENRGNKYEAAKALKESIKSAYSPEKEKKIKEMGLIITPNDLTFYPPLNEDPLGLGNMNWPEFPENVDESDFLEREWNDYKENIRFKMDPIQEKLDALVEVLEEEMENPMKKMRNGQGAIIHLVFAPKYQALRNYYEEENKDLAYQKYSDLVEAQDELQEEVYLLEEAYGKELEELVETMGDRIGEGSSKEDMEEYCSEENEIKSDFLLEINTLLENENAKIIDYWRKTLSQQMNHNRFSLMPEEFEFEKLRSQAMWLAMISEQEVRFASPCVTGYEKEDDEEDQEAGELADFYDMTCKDKSVLNLVIGKITVECNKMTTELDSKFFKYKVKENMDTDQVIQGSVEIGLDFDLAKASEFGPVKAEVKGELYGFVEFDGNGVTDVGIKAGAKATVGSNVVSDDNVKHSLGFADDASITLIGAEARWGWNSGPSLEGKSILQGLSAVKN
jgi:hypothetical protein